MNHEFYNFSLIFFVLFSIFIYEYIILPENMILMKRENDSDKDFLIFFLSSEDILKYFFSNIKIHAFKG